MKTIYLFLLIGFGALVSARAESPQAAAASATLAACKSAGESCTVTYQETDIGWLWKNGQPVNSTTTTVVREVKAPPPPPPPPIIFYPSCGRGCYGPGIVVNR